VGTPLPEKLELTGKARWHAWKMGAPGTTEIAGKWGRRKGRKFGGRKFGGKLKC
jgi:hypothetical protein